MKNMAYSLSAILIIIMLCMKAMAQPNVDMNWNQTPCFFDDFNQPGRYFDHNFKEPNSYKWIAYAACLSSGVTKPGTFQIYQYDRCVFEPENSVIKLKASWIQDTPIQCGSYAIPPNKICDPTHQQLFYKSGIIETYWRTFLYGYFEIKCKFPFHPGSFPAFWLFDAISGDGCYEEIDIAEYSYSPKIGNGTPYKYSTGFLYNKHGGTCPNPDMSFGKTIDYPNNGSITQWHTYGCEWLPGRIIWYLDGEVVNDYYDFDSIPCHPMVIKANYAINSLAMNMDTGIPQWKGNGTMTIDYIKVHELKCDCDTDVIIVNSSQLTNFDQQVKHDITIGSSNGITVPTTTNKTMRACNTITITGPFEVPIGAQLGMMVHPCPN